MDSSLILMSDEFSQIEIVKSISGHILYVTGTDRDEVETVSISLTRDQLDRLIVGLLKVWDRIIESDG